jgi:hypothetical protein
MQRIFYIAAAVAAGKTEARAAAGQNDAKRNDKSHKNAIFNTITLRGRSLARPGRKRAKAAGEESLCASRRRKIFPGVEVWPAAAHRGVVEKCEHKIYSL